MTQQPLRILHLIDSLDLGGAERIAVNMTNALNEFGVEAHIAVTRKDGALKNEIQHQDRYVFLNKRHTLDVIAFNHLLKYVKYQHIQIIHAHSSSLAWAVAISAFTPVNIVWHDHYGNSEFLDVRNLTALLPLVKYVKHVISVNNKLSTWAIEKLKMPPHKVSYLPNFPDLNFRSYIKIKNSNSVPIIVCTANLREPKDHKVLVEALSRIKQQGLNFKAWLIGKDADDDYSHNLKCLIAELKLINEVQILGSQINISDWLIRADIGVLSSSSEGLPVALLEYGLAGLPVVCTTVGECGRVLGQGQYGLLIPPRSPDKLADALKELLQSEQKRKSYGQAFKIHILNKYDKEAVIKKLITIYEHLLRK